MIEDEEEDGGHAAKEVEKQRAGKMGVDEEEQGEGAVCNPARPDAETSLDELD